MTDFNKEKFLSYLATNVGKELAVSIKDKIKEIWLKLEYGITLNPEEGDSLKRIAENEFYKLFKSYLGQHWSLKLIKVGLYISELNNEGKKEKARDMMQEAYKKYGQKGTKIIQLASTGILVPIMDYIISLKLHKGASCIVLNQEFDKILDEWDKISIPVSFDAKEDKLKKEISQKMDYGHTIFFVYSAGSASRIAQLTLAQMNIQHLFEGKYLMSTQHKVVYNTEYCLWIFEKIQDINPTIITIQIKK